MSARLIDGKAIGAGLRAGLGLRVAALSFRPCLRVVLVGEHPASATYVRAKERAAEAAGFDAATIRLPEAITEAGLLAEIRRLNDDDSVDGILVQLPLPKAISADAVIEAIDPAKDVDGFHPLNAGKLFTGR
ncbi:MAG: bifunctional methylenetetrahydrofolate dehydrogenase/methenyltetrahydrofolate cyclohydrolase, partial [Acetobacteraceae bacterium]|nr:bifunctional methylenetetrahydrofolate dehydrogenase/methenyltetrahydrofolate cyclohydrolase [Acetobacteraceae bacterium]